MAKMANIMYILQQFFFFNWKKIRAKNWLCALKKGTSSSIFLVHLVEKTTFCKYFKDLLTRSPVDAFPQAGGIGKPKLACLFIFLKGSEQVNWAGAAGSLTQGSIPQTKIMT